MAMAGAGEEASAVASDKKRSRLAALDRKHTTSPTPTAASSPIVASSGSPSSSRTLQSSTSPAGRPPGSFNTSTRNPCLNLPILAHSKFVDFDL